ncbi:MULTISPECIES: DUF6879 family protein [Streptacidiphilus]|uniref:DUF6879 family protein n=1 Tax=Streptacidiphilus cavernicola TaxID=3342716 RepID=A0ABV6UPY2_9ACTN|nr:DUF6879 family protein [Streptacidiphilus jeojiense]
MQQNVPNLGDLLRGTQRSAVHLEMRDSYGVSQEVEEFEHWKRTGELDLDPESDSWKPWSDLAREAVARGVAMRRARIVSEPVTDYMRWEHASTAVNLSLGENVRWLPRKLASDIALPGNDYWLFDDTLVRFGHFTGDGELVGHEIRTEPAVVKLCADAFDTVWQRATPHQKYSL